MDEQVAANARQQVIVAQRWIVEQVVHQVETCLRPVCLAERDILPKQLYEPLKDVLDLDYQETVRAVDAGLDRWTPSLAK